MLKLSDVVWCPNAGTVLLQNIHAEIKFTIYIVLSRFTCEFYSSVWVIAQSSNAHRYDSVITKVI